MCGRFTLRKPISELSEQIEALSLSLSESVQESDFSPRFNVAPTQTHPVLIADPNSHHSLNTVPMSWGLLPKWSKEASTSKRLINARSETVTQKPSFRILFKRNRCLIPADGYYEWRAEDQRKSPYFFSLPADRIFLMAGLWEPSCEDVPATFTVLTTQANQQVAPYHHRMPVILRDEYIKNWIQGDSKTHVIEDSGPFFEPYPATDLLVRPANPMVNSNRAEGEACLQAPDSEKPSQLDLGF